MQIIQKNGLICPYCAFLNEEKDATLLSGLLNFLITALLLKKIIVLLCAVKLPVNNWERGILLCVLHRENIKFN